MSFNGRHPSAVVGASNDGSPLLQVADEFAQVVFRGEDVQLHNRLEEYASPVIQTLVERVIRGHAKRALIRFAFAGLAPSDDHPNLHQRKASNQAAACSARFEFLDDSGQVVSRNGILAAELDDVLAVAGAQPARAQVTARARPGAVPAWSKGMVPVNAESYYHAIECGKQGGDDPPCVFWDTGLCKNDDFTLAWYSAYKEVAYQVWTAVRKKQPAPQPSYQSAQRTRWILPCSSSTF